MSQMMQCGALCCPASQVECTLSSYVYTVLQGHLDSRHLHFFTIDYFEWDLER